MTTPQSDPVSDIGAAIARLAEQTHGLQRQLTRMEAVLTERDHVFQRLLAETEVQIRELTDAKFVTYETLITSQAEKVALALDATEKAIGKAEVATSKAIDKAEAANDKRFESVNEFRGQLADQARTFMPRNEAQQLVDQVTLRLRELAEVMPLLATRAEIQLMTDRYSERIGELNDRMNRQEGVLHGAKDNRTGLYATLAAGTGLIVAIIIIVNFITSH